ncbi:MAG: DUF362 domain-containing protein [Acidobacteriota bacterium]
MSIYLDEEKCTGCGICVSSCPEQAVTIENNLAIIDQQKCTECLQCMYDCPLDAIYQVLDKETPSAQNNYPAPPAVQDKSFSHPTTPQPTPQSEERIQRALSIGESLMKGIKSVIQYFGSPDSFSREGMRGGGRRGNKRRRRGKK